MLLSVNVPIVVVCDVIAVVMVVVAMVDVFLLVTMVTVAVTVPMFCMFAFTQCRNSTDVWSDCAKFRDRN